MNVSDLSRALAAAVLVIGVGGCGYDGPPALATRPASKDPEFARRLRLGKEQLRHHLFDSARAELERCDSMWPEEPEVLVQRARLELFEREAPGARARAVELLERCVELYPERVTARRLLFELHRRDGDDAGAAKQRKAIRKLYDRLGTFELDWLADGASTRFVSYPEPWEGDYGRVARAFERMRRFGADSSPDEAVAELEIMLEQYPELNVVRFGYAQYFVIKQVRFHEVKRPGLPAASSLLVYDLAQSQVERALDHSLPWSPMAKRAVELLKLIATRMADYEESITLTDILLEWPGVAPPERAYLLKRKGLVYLRSERPKAASATLEEALEGMRPGSRGDLSTRWLLHLAREKVQSTDWTSSPFPFRADLALPGTHPSLVYEDIAGELGIDKLDGASPSAWGDYDRDGDFDLFISGNDSFATLYRNDGETFADVTAKAGLFHVASGFGATFVDYDDDGWVDLYISRDAWRGQLTNSLLRNQRDGTFADVTEAAGVADGGASFVHTWADVDRDGDVDLYVCNGVTQGEDVNRFYRNDGDGTFTDATAEVGLLEPRRWGTIGAAFGDYDRDGWPDLFVSGWMTTNRLFRNRGDGTFEDVSAASGVAMPDEIVGGFVCFFLDYDNDGWLDILRANQAPLPLVLLGLSGTEDEANAKTREEYREQRPALFRNMQDGTFRYVSVEAGLVHPIGAMGAGVADIDNDGFEDLFFGTGDPDMARLEPDRFYHNNGDGTFTDLSFAAGIWNVGKGHGISFVDWDGDGVLEAYFPEGGFVHGDQWPNAFYRNRVPSSNHWLHVDLEGVESNTGAIGARLEVTAGELTVVREVRNGEGFGSTSSSTVEFGLGEGERIDRLEIHWPSGAEQTFTDLNVDQRIFVREGEDWTPWERPR